MKFLPVCACVYLVFVLSSCAAVKIEQCAPVSYKSHRVACFPIDTSLLTSTKLFFQNIREQDDLIFETVHHRVVLAMDQALIGRAVVRLKRACGDLGCLTPEERQDFFDIVRIYESAVRNTFAATHFNWECLMNHAYRQKPWMPAVHWHATPRYHKPVTRFRKVFTDEYFGGRNKNKSVFLTFAERQKIIHELRNAIR